MFSLRIVNVDSYQSAPVKGYDICYSEFRGCEIFKVPIIRIFGITPAGQKGCLHIHGVFPYFSIRCKDVFPNIEAKSLRKYMQELALDIDRALNIAARNSNSHRHHVYKIVITEHIPFYGFHDKAEEFLKIYFYNSFDVSRAAELMTNGVILNKFIQPYEAHIPYILQFFIDYNLFGMNLINVSKFKFRASEDDLVSPLSPLRNQSLSCILDESNTPSNKVWNIGTLSSSQVSNLARQTVCELEVDCCSSEIMNRLNESFSSGKNPGLLAIWEEEKQRRRSENETSQITPVPSQERTDFIETESENFYKKKLRKILDMYIIDIFKVGQKEKKDHMSRDLMDMSSPGVSDLSSTQDEEMLHMMLSLASSQCTQLDDDSILGVNHSNEMQSENAEDETLEMSQLFTGELEEMWSQMLNSDADKNKTGDSTPGNVNEQPVLMKESVNIPQLDGAFDEDFEPDPKKPKIDEKNASPPVTEESLIKSCNLFQPFVKLSPAIIINTDIESSVASRQERSHSEFVDENSSKSISIPIAIETSHSELMDEDSAPSTQTTKTKPLPICVPISKNPHCSLIMNICENSNDVSIEHTCTSRSTSQNDSLSDAEDPSNVVFEIITSLVYKVECLTEGKVSCYEDFLEEYKGEEYSNILLQDLSKEERNAVHKIRTAPSARYNKFNQIRKDLSFETNLSLPIKKRVFVTSWNDAKLNECESCSHPLLVDFSKIGKEVVLVKKLSESDINNVKLNSLKVVIPPLPAHLTATNPSTGVKNDSKSLRLPHMSHMSLIPPCLKKSSKIINKKVSKSKDDKWNTHKKTCKSNLGYVSEINEDFLKLGNSSENKAISFLSIETFNQNIPITHHQKLNISSTSNIDASSISDFKTILSKNTHKIAVSNAEVKIKKSSDSKIINVADSKCSFRNEESKSSSRDENSKSSSRKEAFKSSSRYDDSKNSSRNKDSKSSFRNKDSKSSSKKEDSKNNFRSEDSKSSSRSEDSKKTPKSEDFKHCCRNKDSKSNSKSKESKSSSRNEDPKSSSRNEDPKSSSRNEDPKSSSRNEDPKSSSRNEDPKSSSRNEDPISSSRNEDPKSSSRNEDPKSSSRNEHSKSSSRSEDSKSNSRNEDPKSSSRNEDPKSSSRNEDPKSSSRKKNFKSCTKNKDSKSNLRNEDSTSCFRNKDIKNISINKDSKNCSQNEVSKSSLRNGDSKNSSVKKDSKNCSENEDSKNCSENEDSKNCSENEDSKISYRNKDSKNCSKNENSKSCFKNEDTKNSSINNDTKNSTLNKDSKNCSKNEASTRSSRSEDSKSSLRNEDTKNSSINKNFKNCSKNGDFKENRSESSKSSFRNEDSKNCSMSKDSKSSPKYEDSKSSFRSETSKRNSKSEDLSKSSPRNEDTKNSSINKDSKNCSKNEDFKGSRSEDSKSNLKNEDSKSSLRNEDSKISSMNKDSKRSPKYEDSKSSFRSEDTENSSINNNSKNCSENKGSKSSLRKEDFKKSSRNKDSKISSRNKDSKISSRNKDSKISSRNKESESSSKNKDSNSCTINKDSNSCTINKDFKSSCRNKDSKSSTINKNSKNSLKNEVSKNSSMNKVTKNCFKNEDSKNCSKNEGSKSILRNEDSKHNFGNKYSKSSSKNEDSKSSPKNEDSKSSPKNEDSKSSSRREVSKSSCKNEKSKNNLENNDSESCSRREDFKCSSKNEDSKAFLKKESLNSFLRNKDSEMIPEKSDSKITSCDEVSKIAANNTDVKKKRYLKVSTPNKDLVSLHKKDSKRDSKSSKHEKYTKSSEHEKASKLSENKKDSKLSEQKKDSKLSEQKKDSKTIISSTDLNNDLKLTDSKISSKNEISEVISSETDFKITSCDTTSKIVANVTNSEIFMQKKDLQLSIQKKDSKLSMHQEDSKLSVLKISTKASPNITDFKINHTSENFETDSKIISPDIVSEIITNDTSSKVVKDQKDSRLSMHNTDSLIIIMSDHPITNTDSKSDVSNAVSKTAVKSTDSKIISKRVSSKLSMRKKDSKIIISHTDSSVEISDSKIVCNDPTSEMVSKSDNLKNSISCKNPKVSIQNNNSNIVTNYTASKPTVNDTDCIINPNMEDSKNDVYNYNSKFTANIAISNNALNNLDSLIAMHNKDLKLPVNVKDLTLVVNHADPRIEVNKIDSEISFKKEDSVSNKNDSAYNILSNNIGDKSHSNLSMPNKNSKLHMLEKDSKLNNMEPKIIINNISCKKEGSEIIFDKIDSKFIPCNTEFKVSANNSDSKNYSNIKLAEISENKSNCESASGNAYTATASSITSNTDSNIASSNTDSEMFSHITNSLLTSCCVNSETNFNSIDLASTTKESKNFNHGHSKNENNSGSGDNEMTNFTDLETVKSQAISPEYKKCTMMSELRLYRRKKASLMSENCFQSSHTSSENLLGTYDDIHIDNLNYDSNFINPKIQEKVTFSLQKEYLGSISKSKSPEAVAKCNPVVKLEPCEDLIDKYCKSETDTDCLILGEVKCKSLTKPLPSVKEKRFFRSRSRQLEDQNLSSKIMINHKLDVTHPNSKNKRFLSNRKSNRKTSLNITVCKNSGPILRKRSANFDSPDKKKLAHCPGTKLALFPSEHESLDRKLEQVYDFDSHLNADDYDLKNTHFSSYSLKNKSSSSVVKDNISCKLSLKLNRKKIGKNQKNSIPEYAISEISDSRNNERPRRASSFVNYNEDQIEQQTVNPTLTKKFKKSASNKDTYLQENNYSDDIYIVPESDENSDWSIDDIPVSHERPPESLKCTISKRKMNFINNSHENEKLPIPKFKVRKKKRTKSLNVSIRLKRPSVEELNNNSSNFKKREKSFHHISPKKKKNKKSKRNSQAIATALDVKQKYKKCSETKRKSSIWDFYNTVIRNNGSNTSTSLKSNENENTCDKKPEVCKPCTSSESNYHSNSTPRVETSDVSNSPLLTEGLSDESKKSKNSLKLKLKLKRILTRSNEERIVVVDKELEGIGVDKDESDCKIKCEDNNLLADVSDIKIDEKPKLLKKTLGTKHIKNKTNNFKLNSKFKCPLTIENKKVENLATNIINEEEYEKKIPKFKYKPLLANISKDFLSENMSHTIAPSLHINISPEPVQNVLVISPKKKSPLKNAESIKKELSHLNEMVTLANPDFSYTNLKNLPVERPMKVCKIYRKLSVEETYTVNKNDHSFPAHSRLRDRRSSLGCKISSRRNSLRCHDFKKYFDSDNEDNVVEVKPYCENHQTKHNYIAPDLLSSCKPCTVKLEELPPFEIEKYICLPMTKIHIPEKVMACEPLVASFPSPVVDSKSADSYIDPRKIFDNLFTFSSPSRSQSPINYNTFEISPLVIENDMSCGPFSNDSSEHSRKETLKSNFSVQTPLKPCDVFKSVERDDMGVLWNLAYLSPPQIQAPEKTSSSTAPFMILKNQDTLTRKENKRELDDLQKLASQANQLCSISSNFMEFESENSLLILNEKVSENICSKSKLSFKNILEENTTKVIDAPSFSQTPTNFEEQVMSNKSEYIDTEKEIGQVIKEELKSDPMFEPMESLPNVRILDFQECLVESDSEMNPLLNDSEMDSVMSSADMILSNSIDNHSFDIQTDLSFDDSSLNMQSKSECASEESKNNGVDDVFIKNNIDSNIEKQSNSDLTCNNAIITAADTSSLLISSYKSNTIPVLAINNPPQEECVIDIFEEQDLNANGEFFPAMLDPVPLTENADYVENTTAVKETTPDPPECVNFLEDNELLQSCSVSSTSDIEKNTQTSNALGIPFNGEEDILSMIVKSCDIGEEFDVNASPAEEADNESISSATLCNNLIDNSYVLSAPNFIVSSQPAQSSLQANSENAVSSSSENNLPKNAEIIVLKTEPVNVPDVKHIVYELQNKSLNLTHTDKNRKLSQELGHGDVLLDTMIHSFYGDDSVYGYHSSANNDNNISLACPTLQTSNSFVQSTEIPASLSNPCSLRSSIIKRSDATVETYSEKSDDSFKNLPVPQAKVLNENDSFQLKNLISIEKVPLEIQSNSLFIAHPFQKMSSKRFHFTPCNKPPPRDLIENSVLESEIKVNQKPSNAVDDDSSSSDGSLNFRISTNDTSMPNVFNKTSSDKKDPSSSHNVTKTILHHDGQTLNNSPVLFPDLAAFNKHLISTPSTSNIKKEFPLSSVVVSPINKETGLIANTSKRKRKLVYEDDSESSLKVFKSDREKMYTLLNKYGRSNSLNKSKDSLGNLSYSQIEGPTLENSRGFKVGSDNYNDTQVRHEVQHLTVMSLEIHVNTRSDLRPDPKFDSVTAIFYCIYNDIGVKEEEEIVGMIVVDPVSHHQTSGENSSETLRNYLLLCPGVKNGFIYCVENEVALFEKLIKVIKEWDPDILIGYEIQMSSWGYVIERAEMLNINLRVLLSRLADRKETKILPIEPDPTVTDQTADLSRLNIIGRIVLCVWRLMRKEVTLNVYSFENVYYHVLHKRTPLYAFHDLTNWFLSSQKEKVIRYYVTRVQGSIHLLEKLDVIGRTSELARLFGIQFYEVLSRGSQFRVESMMLRTAAPMSYIPVSPSVRQRSHSRAPECVPLILEPESRFYIDPIVVLDFQSLYPSMIIAYNYCFSTCLGRVEHFGKNVPFEFGCTSLSVPVNLLQKLQNDIHISPTGIAFVKSSARRGIIPSMLEEILNTRVMVKQSMKKVKDNNALKRLLDARQLGLKLIANVTYGYTGASFSGRMPSVEVADSIVGKGRETLERAIHMIENTSKWRAKVVYGDTDSLFILLPGRTKKQAFEIGQEIADAVTADNPKPVKLKFEKVYLPCVLQTKKRYVGFMYETVDQENPTFDAKGIETVRRDSCPATAKILEKSLKTLFKTYDVTLVKNYVQKQFSKLLSGRSSLIDCIFAKEYRGISGYRPGACVPALEIAKKRLAKDPRSEPRVGERVPYVVVYGFPGLPIIQLVREPVELLKDANLRLNASYYITRVISPPLERVFNLLGADVKSWYTNLARTFKPTLPMTRTTNQHRGTLSQYFVTLSCPSCEKPTFTTVCEECREDLQGTTIALNEKIRQWERTVDHLTQICGSCTKSGSSVDSCVSIDCPMLFKLNAAKKDLSQAPYLKKVLAHELF